MEKFTTLEAIAAPLLRINIDTDAIIPSREMKRVSKDGLADGMFASWRYTEIGGRDENPDFILNQDPYCRAQILLAGDNFGCGSSREHAVWAMKEWGFRAVIAPSFGEIYYGNCVRNGVLPIRLEEDHIKALAASVEANPARNLIAIDLPAQKLTAPDSTVHAFDIAPGDKEMLVEGLDPIGVTMRRDEEILAFQATDQSARPWVYLKGAEG